MAKAPLNCSPSLANASAARYPSPEPSPEPSPSHSKVSPSSGRGAMLSRSAPQAVLLHPPNHSNSPLQSPSDHQIYHHGLLSKYDSKYSNDSRRSSIANSTMKY